MNKQTARLLKQHFDTAFAAPDGIKKLRELILTLAMQGRLVPQDPNDQPASELLKQIEAERRRLVKEGKIKAAKPLPEIKAEEVPYALPVGWVWAKLPECYYGIGNKKNQIQTKDYLETGLFPVIDQGKAYIAAYYNEIDKLLKIDRPVIIFGDHTKNIKFIDFDFVIGADGVKILCPYVGVSPRFLYRLLQSYNLTDRGYARHFKVLNEKLIPLPPHPEQHRIVAKIDQLMARCDELEKLRAEQEQKRLAVHTSAIKRLLDAQAKNSFDEAWQFITRHFDTLYSVKGNTTELRKAILQLAVMGKLVPQDPSDPPVCKLLKEIEVEKKRLVKEGIIKKPKPLQDINPDAPIHLIPESWEWVMFGKITSTRLGKMLDKSKNRGNPKPYLRNTNVQWHHFNIDDVKEMKFEDKELEEFRLITGDLLICEGGEPGRCAIWNDSTMEMYFQKAIHRARPFSYVSAEYLQICITNDSGNGRLDQYFTGATIKHLPGDKLCRYLIPLPPVNEQHRIVAKIDQLMSLCDALEQQIDTAAGKQTKLLSALMAQV